MDEVSVAMLRDDLMVVGWPGMLPEYAERLQAFLRERGHPDIIVLCFSATVAVTDLRDSPQIVQDAADLVREYLFTNADAGDVSLPRERLN